MNPFKEKSEFVPPHRIKSREVGPDDYARVISDGERMRAIMKRHGNCLGLAHPQVDDTDPLALFVTHDVVAFDPKILQRSSSTHSSLEGCMTYLGRQHIRHRRFDRILVEYRTVDWSNCVNPEGSSIVDQVEGGPVYLVRRWVEGREADVFQHEIDHLKGIYCYD